MMNTEAFKLTVTDSESRSELMSFLTTEEVLAYLKVTPRTIYRLIRSGELPAVRIGRQYRFRRSDLDGWLDRQRTTAASS
jgi:excisionase family DNA binding protein